jgi:hypothetical protein
MLRKFLQLAIAVASTALVGCAAVEVGSAFAIMAVTPTKSGGETSCDRDLVRAYLEGRQCPNWSDSPMDAKNVNKILPGTRDCPLIVATRNWNAIAMADLFSKGAQPSLCRDAPLSFVNAAIQRACESNPYPLKPVLELLEHKALIGPSSADHLLLLSAATVCVPGLQQAIRLEANPNVRSSEGYTSLHLVTGIASEQAIEATRLLVLAGADPDIPGASGETAFESAQRRLFDAGNWPRLKVALRSGKSRSSP